MSVRNWYGWAALGAIFMMVIGVFQIISGIWGLFEDQWIVLGYNGYFIVDVTGLAVWYIIIGALLLLGGIAVMQGSKLGRIVGIIAASLAIISQLFQLPVHPVWSILIIFLLVMALIGFVVIRGPLRPEDEEELVVSSTPAPTPVPPPTPAPPPVEAPPAVEVPPAVQAPPAVPGPEQTQV